MAWRHLVPAGSSTEEALICLQAGFAEYYVATTIIGDGDDVAALVISHLAASSSPLDLRRVVQGRPSAIIWLIDHVEQPSSDLRCSHTSMRLSIAAWCHRPSP